MGSSMTGYGVSAAVHNYRWHYGVEEVTVRCTRCDVEASFDMRAEWDKCVEWCNAHARLPGFLQRGPRRTHRRTRPIGAGPPERCARGHLYEADRVCRVCRTETQRARRQQLREAA